MPTEVCRRLLWNHKPKAALIADRDRTDVRTLLKRCGGGKTTVDVMQAVKGLQEVLELDSKDVTQEDLAPPVFEGQVRFGKKLDYLSAEIRAAKQNPDSTLMPKDFLQPLPWEF